ncbi:MAG: alcohol dehydrogenase [Candidatus Sulfopaludibacter sp.]|nr:alcohol dehydrogenase [Candidatus Sulfopaludibacter sp.]
MPKMRAVQVPHAGGPLEIVERDIPEPGPGQVRLKVQACGVCHSDSLTKEGHMPGIMYPRVPGHEVVGIVDAVGAGVAGWKPGQQAGVGWNGGYCGYCDNCRRGDFFACTTATYITGVTSDGGYAEYMIARAEAVARLPEGLSPVEAAPLMCAGVTTYNCLRNTGARPGELVAVLGLGGLGHLGVQYAAKMGFKTVAIARGQDKAALATQLGASQYIDSRAQDPAKELQKLGGAKVILATVTAGDAMAAVVGGLGVRGTLMVVGAAMSMQIAPIQLLGGCTAIKGWYSGTSIDSQDTLAFSLQTGVRSMNEVFPLDRASEGYERMMSGDARFRVVLSVA